jgi:hypothetical protein
MCRMTVTNVVDLEMLRAALPESRGDYAAAVPFPHIVIDDVLTPSAYTAAAKEFPDIDDAFWKGYLHVNESKYSNTEPDTWSPALREAAEALTSPEFVAYLEELTGISGLIADWSMDGGGLHQTLRGGHLNVHTDFSTHHDHENWARRINVLLYLNEEWHDAWGGKLELWDQDMTARMEQVTPRGNRMLVFTTSDISYHGHPDGLTCPPDVARRSLALYYFTEEEQAVRRSTHYRARPQDGLKRFAIAADRTALDLYDRAKRRFGVSDALAHRVLGLRQRLRRRPQDRG